MLSLENEMEAYYVCGIINSPSVTKVVDGYAISTNRGLDVLKNIAIPKFDEFNKLHYEIAKISKNIHELSKKDLCISDLEIKLDNCVYKLFMN